MSVAHITYFSCCLFHSVNFFQSDASQGRGRRRKAPERRSQRQMEKEMKDEAEKIRKENQVNTVRIGNPTI